MPEITKDMTIMEIIINHPETMDVFIDSGLHCIGCGISQIETLEEGTMGHGWDEEDLEHLVDELNKTISTHTEEDDKDGSKDNDRQEQPREGQGQPAQ